MDDLELQGRLSRPKADFDRPGESTPAQTR